MKPNLKKPLALLGPVGRLFGWWAALTGLVASTTNCPCCGQVGCPMGAGTASFFGLLGATTITRLKGLLCGGYSSPHEKEDVHEKSTTTVSIQ